MWIHPLIHFPLKFFAFWPLGCSDPWGGLAHPRGSIRRAVCQLPCPRLALHSHLLGVWFGVQRESLVFVSSRGSHALL